MMSTNNILSPANGKPIIVPTQDIVLGLYHLSMERPGEKGESMVFRDLGEIQHALASQSVHMHARIKTRWIGVDENGNDKPAIVETTHRRMTLAEIIPRHQNTEISLVTKVLTKKELSNLLHLAYTK